jgi:hypothetical protein
MTHRYVPVLKIYGKQIPKALRSPTGAMVFGYRKYITAGII